MRLDYYEKCLTINSLFFIRKVTYNVRKLVLLLFASFISVVSLYLLSIVKNCVGNLYWLSINGLFSPAGSMEQVHSPIL